MMTREDRLLMGVRSGAAVISELLMSIETLRQCDDCSSEEASERLGRAMMAAEGCLALLENLGST